VIAGPATWTFLMRADLGDQISRNVPFGGKADILTKLCQTKLGAPPK